MRRGPIRGDSFSLNDVMLLADDISPSWILWVERNTKENCSIKQAEFLTVDANYFLSVLYFCVKWTLKEKIID